MGKWESFGEGEAEEVRGAWDPEANWGFAFFRQMNALSSVRVGRGRKGDAKAGKCAHSWWKWDEIHS